MENLNGNQSLPKKGWNQGKNSLIIKGREGVKPGLRPPPLTLKGREELRNNKEMEGPKKSGIKICSAKKKEGIS